MHGTYKVANCSCVIYVFTRMLLNNSLRMSTSHLFTLSMTWVEMKYQQFQLYKELTCFQTHKTEGNSENSPFVEGHGLTLNLQIHQPQEQSANHKICVHENEMYGERKLQIIENEMYGERKLQIIPTSKYNPFPHYSPGIEMD